MASNTTHRSITTVVIPNGTATSSSVSLSDFYLCAIDFPIMTGTSVTFEGSVDGVTWKPVKDKANTAHTITVDGTATIRTLEPTLLAGVKYLRLVSGSNEGAERTINLLSYQG